MPKLKAEKISVLIVLLMVSVWGNLLQAAAALSIENKQDLMQQEIKHVVVLMLENRSFDNVFGWLYDGDDPSHFIPANQRLPFQGLSKETIHKYTNFLINSSGDLVYSCAPVRGIPSTAGSRIMNSPKYDPNESFDYVSKQIFGIKGNMQPSMLGFLQDYASLWDESDWTGNKQTICAVMESYTAEQLPVLHGLARHYAVSDLWFSSVPTQTNPNRAFFSCGTSMGQIVNGSFSESTFYTDTIWNRLQEQAPNTSWKIFWQADMIPEIAPGPFTNPAMFPALNRIPNIEQHYELIDAFHQLAREGKLPDFSFIEPQWSVCEIVQLAELQKNYPDSEFRLGIYGNDMHPPVDVRAAENLVANIYTSLISNTEAWEKTLFVILFDEHGGIFDHISPPTSLPPDDHFEYGFTFDRYGVRTPALFISPRIKQKTVIRSDAAFPFDHTSFIATLLKWKNIDSSKWNLGKRVAIAPTFEKVITESIARPDSLVTEQNFVFQEGQPIHMGDPLVLKDSKGNFLKISKWSSYATVGSKDPSRFLSLFPGAGTVTHGSFVLIKCVDPSFSDDYLLDNCSIVGECYFNKNSHHPSQWWTIKSVDFPFLGYEIKSGDRVYLECLAYLDPITFVPCRLATSDSCIWGREVITKPVSDIQADDQYWIVNKIVE